MKCPKCDRELGVTGTVIADEDITNQLPQEIIYWCENRGCENYQIPGDIVNNKFISLRSYRQNNQE